MRDCFTIRVTFADNSLNPVLEIILISHSIGGISPDEPCLFEGNFHRSEHFSINIIGPLREELYINGLGINVLENGVFESVEQQPETLLQNDCGTCDLNVVPVCETADIKDLNFLVKVAGLRLLDKMEPVNHLNSIPVLNVCDVEVVLKFDDFEALDLSELWFLVVEEHLVGILDCEEGPISVDLGLGVTWEMGPDVLRLCTENHLLCGEFLQF